MRNSNALALVTLALVGVALLGPGCARRVRVQSPQAAVQAPQYYAPAPTTVLLSQAQPPEVVRAAVIRSLTDLGYQFDGEDGTRVLARYSRGRQTVRIQVEYWATQATVSYLGSEGLRFRRDGASPQYDRWMSNLSSSIQSNVAMFARQHVGYAQGYQAQGYQGGQYVVVQPAPAQQQVVVAPAPTVVAAPAPTVVAAPATPGTVVVEGTVSGGGVQGTMQGTVVVTP